MRLKILVDCIEQKRAVPKSFEISSKAIIRITEFSVLFYYTRECLTRSGLVSQ